MDSCIQKYLPSHGMPFRTKHVYGTHTMPNPRAGRDKFDRVVRDTSQNSPIFSLPFRLTRVRPFLEAQRKDIQDDALFINV